MYYLFRYLSLVCFTLFLIVPIAHSDQGSKKKDIKKIIDYFSDEGIKVYPEIKKDRIIINLSQAEFNRLKASKSGEIFDMYFSNFIVRIAVPGVMEGFEKYNTVEIKIIGREKGLIFYPRDMVDNPNSDYGDNQLLMDARVKDYFNIPLMNRDKEILEKNRTRSSKRTSTQELKKTECEDEFTLCKAAFSGVDPNYLEICLAAKRNCERYSK